MQRYFQWRCETDGCVNHGKPQFGKTPLEKCPKCHKRWTIVQKGGRVSGNEPASEEHTDYPVISPTSGADLNKH